MQSEGTPPQALPEIPVAFRRFAAGLFLLFWALLLLRTAYSVWSDEPTDAPTASPRAQRSLDFFSFPSSYQKDYSNNAAAFDLSFDQAIPAGQLGALEVYTREARVGATTDRFETAVAEALEIIADHGASVRMESNEGVAPNRSFRVVIRAPLDRFDACVERLRACGELQAFSIIKEDKSEEVRERFAEREALRAHAESLGKLRESGGDVADLIRLETQIQQVEAQVQKLNVALGDFVKDESFNNVNYSLREEALFDLDAKRYPLTLRLAQAASWSFGWTFLTGSLVALAWLTRLSIRQFRTA